ncbi:MAG: DUF6438 domain-containing protein [Flavobacteriales bacterium]
MRKLILLTSLGMTFLFACKSKEEVVLTKTEAVAEVTEPVAIEPVEELVSATDTVLFYRRTACFGMCPSFDFVVQRSGNTFYEGRNFVDLIGSYQGTTSQESIIQIIAKANEMRYDTLQTKYDNRLVSDLPSVQTEINGKLVINRYQGPNLNELYTELDSMIARIDWKPKSETNK